ncbi:IniB N-terminal domain-containing protein [Amycolatopsis sp. H20-H5]|uniref:IniB N-terminal domain-containing protein n=1 Tax=Amycolatopsis sp. H20-H5 TaxID=3046309 RepID=UPI002DBD05EF|nr:IniB N-terminal domain-containing protein [Amycolatopsis sp. H20-H5]MEC3977354.1 IniB N-terminal domain-containing protein [Amycolatopsis sp. H20-H5]
MDPAQTLHDFTMNLLNDSAARQAFGADPERSLSDAGLGDVSAADVHEVLPLVLDYAPVSNMNSLGNLGTDHGFGVPQDGPQGAIEQLKAFTQNFGVNDNPADANIANAAGLTAIAKNLTGDFHSGADLSHGLDSSIVGNATGAITGNVDHAQGLGDVTSHVSDLTGAVSGGDATGAVSGGDLTSAITGAVGNGHTQGLGDVTNHLGDLTSGIKGANDLDVKHVVGDLTSHVGDVANVGHNSPVTEVTSHIGDVANNIGAGSGVSDVHDVVSHTANGIGNVGDIGHVDVGGILSGNDVHLSH